MGATIQQDENGIWVVHIAGALRKEELDAIQDAALKEMGLHGNAKVLAIVEEDFCGWVGDEEWNDMTFFVRHGDKIEKMAIVGDAKWETRMLMFAGAGFRRAPVKYFTRNQLAVAQAWLR